MYIYTYIHTYIHTYIRTYIQTYLIAKVTHSWPPPSISSQCFYKPKHLLTTLPTYKEAAKYSKNCFTYSENKLLGV